MDVRSWLINVYYLCLKEFRGVLSDRILLGLVVFAFTIGVISATKGAKVDISDASVGIIDFDHSQLSERFRDALLPKLFRHPIIVDPEDGISLLNSGNIIFLVEIPAHFESNLLAGRQPAIQIQSDATAMLQAALGSIYIRQIIFDACSDFLKVKENDQSLYFKTIFRNMYNQNVESAWFISTMQVVTNITVITIVIVGSAFIRERERGTLEHLLVMPLNASEIVASKLIANGIVVFLCACISLYFVVHLWLAVPLFGSFILYALILAAYIISVGSMGLLIATFAPSLPQFALLVVPVYTVAFLLSGAATPVQSMPYLIQILANELPTTKFVKITSTIILQGYGFEQIKFDLLYILIFSVCAIAVSLLRFKKLLSKQWE
jgi:ABC-2 type transport system permease protein